jgi:hypothetical protein
LKRRGCRTSGGQPLGFESKAILKEKANEETEEIEETQQDHVHDREGADAPKDLVGSQIVPKDLGTDWSCGPIAAKPAS